MELTPERKQAIDNMSYEALLAGWRFAPIGDTRFQGEHGEYWAERMAALRSQPDGDKLHTKCSKSLGWD